MCQQNCCKYCKCCRSHWPSGESPVLKVESSSVDGGGSWLHTCLLRSCFVAHANQKRATLPSSISGSCEGKFHASGIHTANQDYRVVSTVSTLCESIGCILCEGCASVPLCMDRYCRLAFLFAGVTVSALFEQAGSRMRAIHACHVLRSQARSGWVWCVDLSGLAMFPGDVPIGRARCGCV